MATQPSLLAPYADQIAPQELYTVRRIAALLDMAPTSVSSLLSHGFLPGSRLRPHARGGRVHVWTGRQLLRIARRPVRVEYDHAKYAPATLYRVGCRCRVCMAAHSAESWQRRRALAEEAFSSEQRRQVLALVEAETPVHEAAEQVGVTPQQVYGRANWDLEFAEQLDEAAWSLCVFGPEDPQCSTAGGYRGNERGGRPACRGTGCRESRRGMAQWGRTTTAR
ncbi:hypothetical protein [Streptomyces celluloflavus]|uniref:hypothetical protein n=1 Tax=Streptomyces celluloflavus TaxID=58344 RepID=UPI003689221D